MEDIRQIFGRNLKTLREAQGLSQEKLAEYAGVHRTYISAVERGIKNVSLKNIEKIAIALGKVPKDLL